ncbi:PENTATRICOPEPTIDE REPEAT-CONTAINING PROTEIN-RELATED [Salix koriyanagi]|uniref:PENTATRICOPEPTIDE REPEAT-CONTAINING PROTEIN-RELATED n=1 Tax=Salix koriyanagi TaxID=2511006 RepID=A0A9Q0VQH2_9ROSI|nr:PENTATRICOPEPTIDE REPEAT-CONTAINING PROTEIN-RELATED [Salix koriyanagi]
MNQQAESLLHFVVSRKGKGSASSVFASILETKGTLLSSFVFDALMSVYTECGYLADAIQCFRLTKKHNLKIPFNGCKCLLERMIKMSSPMVALEFYLEILDSGYPPNVYSFNVLMNRLCKEGKVKDAQLIFDEIWKTGLQPTAVSFNTLINGYYKSGNLEEGFRLKMVMEEFRVFPDVFTYSALIDGIV